MSEPIFEKITTHVTRALARFIEQYKDKTKIKKLMEIYIDKIQELEVVYYDLFDKFLLDTATGDQLDILGSIVGEARLGDTDADYRLRIRTRIRINQASGTADDLLYIAYLVTGFAHTIEDLGNASCRLILQNNGDDASSINLDVLRSRLDDTKAAGVKLEYWYDQDDDFAFQFSTSDTIETDVNKGFADDISSGNSRFADAMII